MKPADDVVPPVNEMDLQRRRYVDIDGENYRNFIRALARQAARADHESEVSKEAQGSAARVGPSANSISS